jgi:hypothetical protein
MTAPEYILAGCAALGVLANWGTNRFYYGKLTQTVTTTSDEVNRLRGKVENHGERLVAHDERIGALENSKVNGHAAGRSH